MTDRIVEALRLIAPATRGQAEMKRDGPGGTGGGSPPCTEEVGGGRMLRWVESGAGRPTAILIAGRNDTALSWGPVLAALAGRAHAVAYDRAGLGDSDPDMKIPSAERSVADLSRLINVVSAGPCVVAGHSYGGLLALLLAAAHPGQLAGLVLVDPVLPGLVDWLPRPARRVLGTAMRVRPAALYATGLYRPLARRTAADAARAFSDDPWVRDRIARAYLASADRAHVLAGYREGLGIVASEPAIRRALAASGPGGLPLPVPPGSPPAVPPGSPPAVPAVVFSATEGRPARVRRHWTALQAELAARIGAAHVVVPGSGHAVHHHSPALVAEAILGFA